MKTKIFLWVILITASFVWPSAVFAQNTGTNASISNVAAPSEASENTSGPASGADATTPAEGTPSASETCFPKCRDGYLCHKGLCISACNPPCADGFACTAAAQCVQVTPPPPQTRPMPTDIPKPQRQRRTAEEKKRTQMDYRRRIRLMFASDVALGALRDMDISEASIHLGLGVRKNITDKFGLMFRTNLIAGLWEDTTVSESERAWDADNSTEVVGYDMELMPYFGPFEHFYFGPIANFRAMYPRKNEVLLELDNIYYESNQYVRIKFPDQKAMTYGLGGGFLIGTKELINITWHFYSSFTKRIPIYGQIGISFDLPFTR